MTNVPRDQDELMEHFSAMVATGTWTLVVAPDRHTDWLASIEACVSAALGEPLVINAAALTCRQLATALARKPGPAIVHDFSMWAPEEWPRFDEARDTFRRDGAVVWIVVPAEYTALERYCPNAMGLMRASTFVMTAQPGAMTDDEVAARIASLEAQYGFSTAELIAMASRNELPAEPECYAWLVYAGRGDLLPARELR